LPYTARSRSRWRSAPSFPRPPPGTHSEGSASGWPAGSVTVLRCYTGPGGIGKTRLAVAAAQRLRDHFPGGTAFVPLAAVSDPGLLLASIGQAVGSDLTGTRSPAEALAEQLGDEQWLLILDNLEQLVSAAADLGELLTRSAGLEFLVTSRTVLGLGAEREYPVPPLPLPADPASATVGELAAAPAVELFVRRPPACSSTSCPSRGADSQLLVDWVAAGRHAGGSVGPLAAGHADQDGSCVAQTGGADSRSHHGRPSGVRRRFRPSSNFIGPPPGCVPVLSRECVLIPRVRARRGRAGRPRAALPRPGAEGCGLTSRTRTWRRARGGPCTSPPRSRTAP